MADIGPSWAGLGHSLALPWPLVGPFSHFLRNVSPAVSQLVRHVLPLFVNVSLIVFFMLPPIVSQLVNHFFNLFVNVSLICFSMLPPTVSQLVRHVVQFVVNVSLICFFQGEMLRAFYGFV